MHFSLPEKFETPVVMVTLKTDCHKIRTQPQGELYSKLESLNHGIIKVEKEFLRSSSPAINLTLLGSLLNHVTSILDISRDGHFTTSLDSLFQYLTTLSEKKFFVISYLNLTWDNLRQLSFRCWVISLQFGSGRYGNQIKSSVIISEYME